MDIHDVIHWLQEGEEWSAADLLTQCDFDYYYITTGFPINDGPEIDVVGLNIQSPRRVLDRLAEEFKESVCLIEKAVETLSQTKHCYVREINWVAKVGGAPSPSDSEIELALGEIDSEHVRSAWNKALSRRTSDPDGAITSAKTLIEAVCKYILNCMSIEYPPNQDLNSLYHLIADHLNLSPTQHVDKNVKRILGSCQAIVSGIAFLRNELGDAHSKEPGGTMPTKADAELAVNLAGAISMFLVKSFEDYRTRDREQNV